MIRKVALYALFALLALSCLDEPDCYNLSNSVIGIGFRKIADNQADTVALLGITANGTDSIFYAPPPSRVVLTTGVELPLDVLGSESDITFQFVGLDGSFVRHLRMTYTSRSQFVSEECGPRYIISGLQLEEHDFDSVRLINDSPGREPTANFFVYRCPTTNNMKIGFRQLGMNTDSLGTALNVFVDAITADFSPLTLYEDDTASTFILPLNPASTSVSYHFDFTEGEADLAVDYRTVTRTRYTACGDQTFFGGLTVSSADFDKVMIVRDSIRDPAVTNVLLLRCPDTNLVKIDFVSEHGDEGEAVAVTLNGITTDYSTEVFYEDETVSSVILPLNTEADLTRFTFDLESGPVDLEVGYTRTPVVYHETCADNAISDLSILSSEFNSEPQVLEDIIAFPVTTTNLAIIPD